jgi:hypothetical protein
MFDDKSQFYILAKQQHFKNMRKSQTASDHFVDINKTIAMPKGATKEIDD